MNKGTKTEYSILIIFLIEVCALLIFLDIQVGMNSLLISLKQLYSGIEIYIILTGSSLVLILLVQIGSVLLRERV